MIPNDFLVNQYLNIYHKLSIRTFVGMTLCILVIYYILQSNISNIYPTLWVVFAIVFNLTRIVLKPNFKNIKAHLKLITYFHFVRGLIFAMALLGFHELVQNQSSKVYCC